MVWNGDLNQPFPISKDLEHIPLKQPWKTHACLGYQVYRCLKTIWIPKIPKNKSPPQGGFAMFATEAKALIDLHPSSNLSAQCTIDEWEELCIRKHRTKLLTGLRRSSENSFTKQFCWHLAIVQLDAIRVQWFRKKSWGWQVVVIVGKKNWSIVRS